MSVHDSRCEFDAEKVTVETGEELAEVGQGSIPTQETHGVRSEI